MDRVSYSIAAYSRVNFCSHYQCHRLYQNRLGDKGVIDMVPGLLQAKSLDKLRCLHLTIMVWLANIRYLCSLVENAISDSGAKALTGYLSTTNTLTEMR